MRSILRRLLESITMLAAINTLEITPMHEAYIKDEGYLELVGLEPLVKIKIPEQIINITISWYRTAVSTEAPANIYVSRS